MDINQTWQGCGGEGPLQSIYISLWFDEIRGHQRRSSILIGLFSKMFSYEITMQNNLKLCRIVLCEVFYKRSIFGSGWTNKLGRQQRYIFWSTYFMTDSTIPLDKSYPLNKSSSICTSYAVDKYLSSG